MLESILKRASERDVLIIILGSLAIVGFWRGVWNLLDMYLLPGNFILSQIISIIAGIIILAILSKHKIIKTYK